MQNSELACAYPNDAAIIQKTFIKNGYTPVFILAGFGTTGTSSAGHFLAEHAVELGKLYGGRPFCLLLHCRMDEGRESVVLAAAHPEPVWYRAALHPATYSRFRDKFVPSSDEEQNT